MGLQIWNVDNLPTVVWKAYHSLQHCFGGHCFRAGFMRESEIWQSVVHTCLRT